MKKTIIYFLILSFFCAFVSANDNQDYIESVCTIGIGPEYYKYIEWFYDSAINIGPTLIDLSLFRYRKNKPIGFFIGSSFNPDFDYIFIRLYTGPIYKLELNNTVNCLFGGGLSLRYIEGWLKQFFCCGVGGDSSMEFRISDKYSFNFGIKMSYDFYAFSLTYQDDSYGCDFEWRNNQRKFSFSPHFGLSFHKRANIIKEGN